MLTGTVINENGFEYVDNYPSCFKVQSFPCSYEEGGEIIAWEWAIPYTEDGLTVAGFNYEIATGNTKPRPDAIKTFTLLKKMGGGYVKVAVADNYALTTFVTACCAGCSEITAPTIVAPLLDQPMECVTAIPVCPPCTYTVNIPVAPFTGTNDTYTATGYCIDANGNVVTLSPTTATGTSVALLAAAAQTAWASELGSGTFTAVGNSITVTSSVCANFGMSIVQSDAP